MTSQLRNHDSSHESLLALGGFSADREGFLRQYADDVTMRHHDVMTLPTTNGAFAKGDGVRIAQRDVDAKVALMSRIQIHPTGKRMR